MKMVLTEEERSSLSWRKSAMSTNNGSCVQVAAVPGKVILGDSKDPLGPVLVYTPTEFHAFLDGARKGEFDDFLDR